MDTTIYYLKEAEGFLAQVKDENYIDYLFEDGEETSAHNDEMKQKASNSIGNAIKSFLDAIGKFIASILDRIRSVFDGNNNVQADLQNQYNALSNLVPEDINRATVQIVDIKKYTTQVRRIIKDIESARKAKNVEKVGELRAELDGVLTAENAKITVPLKNAIDDINITRELTKHETKMLQNLQKDIEGLQSKLDADDAKSNGEETAMAQTEMACHNKSISHVFKSLGENVKAIRNGVGALIDIAKSKGKDVSAIIRLVDVSYSNPAMKSITTALTGAAAAVLDKDGKNDANALQTASRLVGATNKKQVLGAGARLANTVLKTRQLDAPVRNVASVARAFTPQSKKEKRVNDAAKRTVNSML